ncbi:MAG TPA: ABC transporter substrate-binding protein [Burkholderiales bacterium]|nr:ABC transporter substrate-binding protein [Burkholderiales bacterium]
MERTCGGMIAGMVRRLAWFALAVGCTCLGTAQAQKVDTLRLADQPGAEVDYAAVWVAEALGYYEQERIRIDRHTYPNGPAALLDLPSGNVDAVMAGLAPIMQFIAGGGNAVMVVSVTKGNAALVGRKQYKSYADLNGKKVGTPGLGTIHDAMLSYVEKSQNLKFQRVPGKITDIAVMLDRGEVEAFIGWEPASAAAIARAKDAHYVAQLPPIPNAESLEIVIQPKIAKDNPDLVVRFLRATLRGMDYIKNNSKDKIAQIVAKKMNDPSAEPVARAALDSVILTEPRVDMPSSRIILKTIADQGKISQDLVKDVDGWIGKYLDYSFLQKAQATMPKS